MYFRKTENLAKYCELAVHHIDAYGHWNICIKMICEEDRIIRFLS